MDDVEAHVPGPDQPQDGVEVGAVVVEQPTHPVDGGRDGGDVLLEEPEGVRVGQHDPGHVLVELGGQGVHVHAATGVAGHGDHLVAAEGHRRRVGPVGGVGDDDLVAGPALGGVPRPHQQQAGQLAGGAGGRLEGGGRHAGDLAEDLLQLHQQAQPPLGQRGGRRRVDPGQAGEGGHRVADLGVVLHGARPERVGPEVHRELAVGQPGEVGHQVALGDLGHRHRLGPQVLGRQQVGEGGLGDAGGAERPGAPAGVRQLEEGRLGVVPEEGGAGGPATRGGRPVEGGGGAHAATALAKAST